MRIARLQSSLRIAAFGGTLVAASVCLSGCGEDTKTGQVQPADPAAVDASNKAMEDYMKSPEGKKAANPK